MKYYLKIKKAELIPDTFGQHLKITMIGLYDENDKWIKWVKLNDALIEELLNKSIEI